MARGNGRRSGKARGHGRRPEAAAVDARLQRPSPGIGHNGPPPDAVRVRLGVVGSRSFRNERLLREVLSEYEGSLEAVISGGADGADRMGARWARRVGLEPIEHLPDHKRYRHPYHHRNRLIAEDCTVLVAFWDGHSSGTRYTIDYARRIGRTVRVVRF